MAVKPVSPQSYAGLLGHPLPDLPEALSSLADLASDLRWTWSHGADSLWKQVEPALWEKSQNPYVVLQNVPYSRLLALSQNAEFCAQLEAIAAERDAYLCRCGWYGEKYPDARLGNIAFFSMEYGLGGALPFYAGGLGILSGDILKTASDLCVPLVAVGLLYYQGYSHQIIDASGQQHEIYTSCDPATLPVKPVLTNDGDWLKVPVDLPGRQVWLRVWLAQAGSVALYLLDSNHPLNSATDRGITSQLYGGGPELRLQQELALGIGGWRALEALNLEIDICHLNEGHAAFVVLERTASVMARTGLSFGPALWASRAGTLFTTHTPVAAGFDIYDPALISQYSSHYAEHLGISVDKLLDLGRAESGSKGQFNMACFALRGSLQVNAVSRAHGATSRHLFRALYPRWPLAEIPIPHITNGIHMASWDSRWSDELWTDAAGKERWRGGIDELSTAISSVTDQQLWKCRTGQRQDLIEHIRWRYHQELSQRGASTDAIEEALRVLDPNILTIGFARRFTEYKRPHLLLLDEARLARLLNHLTHPVQIVIAGKADGRDSAGKALVHAWANFARQLAPGSRAVFLQDYDIVLARKMVQGVDLWLNTPLKPWEACGTSGMKVLVNGGLNISVLDGWWEEAYTPECGWAITGTSDSETASHLLSLLEQEVVPMFYQHDSDGLPREWIRRIRASMANLTPRFSSNRMLQDYIERFYFDAGERYRARCQNNGELAAKLHEWQQTLHRYWRELRWQDKRIQQHANGFSVEVDIYLNNLSPDWVKVELYADADGDSPSQCLPMRRLGLSENAVDSHIYRADVVTSRPPSHFTPRASPYHEQALVPQELADILWWQAEP
tara:strand:+ start:23678 stop:26215 length:2538 start_codon:yes stop_codon:yes gene_type:complete